MRYIFTCRDNGIKKSIEIPNEIVNEQKSKEKVVLKRKNIRIITKKPRAKTDLKKPIRRKKKKQSSKRLL